ncbi:hypothetical protein KPH14_001444 [Odynerus spinipes]|uniref:Swi5-dependent recombination DNA repair protein 1 homolog n=1 Tax=Odynerus spinipes TaxID=1348599 RepID=A0AAD9RVF8_9HYME|nr:hypothetical protein KPH14_001444 [Odynerus spinipes]
MTLKNSPAVNKPFRSLFNNVDVTPKSKSNVKSLATPDLKSKAKENAKRKLSQELVSVKKIRFDIKSDIENIHIDESAQVFQEDLEELQKRIVKKQKEIEVLRNEISYCKKNNCVDLEADIKQWRSACQDALERLHKDLQDKRGQTMTMEEILSSLGIPANLIYYSVENDTFTK